MKFEAVWCRLSDCISAWWYQVTSISGRYPINTRIYSDTYRAAPARNVEIPVAKCSQISMASLWDTRIIIERWSVSLSFSLLDIYFVYFDKQLLVEISSNLTTTLIIVIRNIERHSRNIATPSIWRFLFLLCCFTRQTSKSDNKGRKIQTDRCIDKTLETIETKFGRY